MVNDGKEKFDLYKIDTKEKDRQKENPTCYTYSIINYMFISY